ncbi:MAG: DUF5677 domain-containing protein [Flavobacterium sp. JAD_PAG50586_2]|nr:MAG: DUF5677 domain-containing protein [Flavobacterium sp. JAD_PAG50586_2]
MRTNPIEEIFPQEQNDALNTILEKLSIGINELVNFGTHIINWDIKVTREGKDNNIPTIFLRNCIELADSISILLKKSSVDPSKILFRALMENSFALQYMIAENEKLRAHSFLVCKANKDIRYYKQFVPTESISKEFVAKIKKEESDFNLSSYCDIEEIKNVIKGKLELLKEPIYNEVNDEFLKVCKSKKTNNPNWYSLYDGPENFQELCKKLNSTILYEFPYRKYSQNVHGIDVMKGFVLAGESRADIIQIRDFQDCKEVFYYTVNIILDLYKEYITKRIPDKSIDYENWYNDYVIFFDKLDGETKFNYIK